MNTHTSRRMVLGSIASAVAGTAGCTSDANPGGSGDTFESVQVRDETIVVRLADSSDVSTLNLISPEGAKVSSKDVVAGQTKVSFHLGMRYTPGEFKITSESGPSTSLHIAPDLSIQEVGIGQNYLDRMPDELANSQEDEVLLTVKNSGNGPTAIRGLAFHGEIPSPTTKVLNSDRVTGIFETSEGDIEGSSVPVYSEEIITLYSLSLPFSFAGTGRTCKSMPDRGVMEVKVDTTVLESLLISEYAVEYNLSKSKDECQMKIVEKIN